MPVKPYLQLVRLPNLFTAAADSLAGWLLVGGSLTDLRHWPWLALASVSTYAGGVVLNDVFDVQTDLRERPGRPIPSGRVGLRTAVALGAGLLLLGVLSAGLAGTPYGLVTGLALAGCVLAYDAGLKSTVLGPELMGACRGLNLLLGASQAARLGGPGVWVVALAYGLFVTGITWVSRSEVQPQGDADPAVQAGAGLQILAMATLILVALRPRAMGIAVTPEPLHVLLGASLLAVVASVIARRTMAAVATDRPEVVRLAVKTAILALVWLHFGLLLSARGPVPALAVGILWIPAVVTGRWVYST